MDILDLYSKPVSYQFSTEETEEIKKHFKKSDIRVKYCIYNKHSKRGTYIGVLFDLIPLAPRRSAYMNYWKVMAERPCSELEYEELVANFGCNRRRFIVYPYKTIDFLQKEDALYQVKTPSVFVKKCMELGYVEPKNQVEKKQQQPMQLQFS